MFKTTVNNQLFEIVFSDKSGLNGLLNNESFKMDLVKQGTVYHVLHNSKTYALEMLSFNKDEKSCVVKVNNKEVTVSVKDKYDALLKQLGMENLNSKKVNEVKAPMPGLVLSILIEPGQEIFKGDGLFVLEAMKMENIIKSPSDAVVKSIEVIKGNAVEKNEVLVKFV